MTVALFGAGFLVPGIVAHDAHGTLGGYQAMYVVVILAVAAFSASVVRRWSTRPDWGPRHTLAVITGLLLPAAALTTLEPAAFLGGAALLSVPFIGLLVHLARRYRRTG